MKSIYKYIIIASTIPMILSCSSPTSESEGGSSSGQEVTLSENELASNTEETTENTMETGLTKDLKSEDDFLFRSIDEIRLSINIDDQANAPNRITLCKYDENHEFDSSDCLYSGRVTESGFDQVFSLPSNISSLALVLWFFEPNLERQVHKWERGSASHWQVDL